MRILAIETSCDDTGIAILEIKGSKKSPVFNVLSNIVSSQIEIHKEYGGVYPMLAKREHQKIGKLLSKLKFDQVIGIGPLLKETGKKTEIIWAKDIIEAAKIVENLKLNSKDILYLKGSLLKHMERLLLYLEGEKIGCRVISCNFYQPCNQCPKL